MDIERLETIAYAEDRAAALEHLVPGTEDYYFYYCLHWQHTGELDRVESTLQAWIERHGRTIKVQGIERRQALLSYANDPKAALAQLAHNLYLHFDHQRQVEGESHDYPCALGDYLDDRARLAEQAFLQASDLSGFTGRALDWLLGYDLDSKRRRHLLERLERPDYPYLVDHVAADLADKRTGGFGSLRLHSQLLPQQLDQLAERVPKLRDDPAFVGIRLRQLAPSPDVDMRSDPDEYRAYLDRLQDFVGTLSPVFNSLAALITYHRLDWDRQRGAYDMDRFRAYLNLPKHAHYVPEDALYKVDRRHIARLADAAPLAQHTELEPVGDDAELVRDYLLHFLADAEDTVIFTGVIREDVLRRQFATAKILGGVGDQERWYALLDSPKDYQRLSDRVDVEFAPTNPDYFVADAQVALEVYVKNVPTLVVKVFEINTRNHFFTHGHDVDTSVDLDGMVATYEATHKYDEPPARRALRRFEFPELARPGTYVVELVGAGKSSRALIRKGGLRYVERLGAAGHVFTILDEDNQRLDDATLWLSGREYSGQKDGTIAVPYSTAARRETILLCHGDRTTVETFEHQAELYRLLVGIYVEREQLIARNRATVVIRPLLKLNGVSVPIRLLRDPVLAIEARDLHGVRTHSEAPIELFDDRETGHEFQVPADLAEITFTLRGQVRNLSEQRDIDLDVRSSYRLNHIDATPNTEDMHLTRSEAGYALYVLGKSGEIRVGKPINLSFFHRDFARSHDITLQTDERGRIDLGPLPDVARITAKTPSGVNKNWALERDSCTYPQSVHSPAGETISLPYMYTEGERQRVSLLETRTGTAGTVYIRDVSACARIDAGYVHIEGLEPGDYDLAFLPDGARLSVRVTRGARQGAWAAGAHRLLEMRKRPSMQITGVTRDDSDTLVQLTRCSSQTRVHVVATRLIGERSLRGSLGKARASEPTWVDLSTPESLYISGRDIGDEYRYILERRQASKFPGNMLERPSVLLNPWSLRTTSTGVDHAAVGGDYARMGGRKQKKSARPAPKPRSQPVMAEGFANLEFLPGAARMWLNLRPDESGTVRIPTADLDGARLLRLLAIDGQGSVYREFGLPDAGHQHRDLRLSDGLAADKHFGEKKQVSVLQSGEALAITDIETATVESYDNLGRVYRLFMALSQNSTLTEFSFILEWPDLDPIEKRKRYSKYACHELNLFLAHKDPAFFAEVIQPYLRNKLHKTFLDHYLLEDDLSEYLEPWAYGRLNIAERILLSRRIVDEGGDEGGDDGPGTRHIRNLFDLLPPDVERENHLFQTALGGSALSTEDTLGFAEAKTLRKEQTRGRAADKNAMRSVGRVRGFGGGPSGSMPPPAPPPPPPSAAPASASFSALEPAKAEAAFDTGEFADMADDDIDFDDEVTSEESIDMFLREDIQQLYRAPDKTKEWAENNYYRLRIHQQGATLIPINAFWRDFAEHDGKSPFLSPNIAYATSNFTEMMLALSVLDLPFRAAKHKVAYAGARMDLSSASPCIVFHKEIKPVERTRKRVPVLVNQNYFRLDDRYEYDGNERIEKYVTGEMLVHVVYQCQVVLTNPTSSPQKLELLLQSPSGSMPVSSGFTTRSMNVTLAAHGTHAVEYAFYFPHAGEFSHYPVHVTKNEALVAAPRARPLSVVERLSKVDTSSWAYVSQHGDTDQVITYLENNNIARLDLALIAWRMRDRDFYRRTIDLLARYHTYQPELWSYSVHHDERADIVQFLAHQDGFVNTLGPHFHSPLLTVEPVTRSVYEHLEYSPLVNARAHRLGDHVKILNDELDGQYRAFLRQLTYKPAVDADDLLSATYYLLLQDRIETALAMFDRIVADEVSARLQYDYSHVFVNLYRGRVDEARAIAERHRDYPVDRWRKRFQAALAVLDEARGEGAVIIDHDDRAQVQSRLAATDQSFDFKVESRSVTITYHNLSECRVNYYPMDIELLFSRQPFMQQQSQRFSIIRPHHSDLISLPADGDEHTFELPESYHSANIIVEVVAAGRSKSQAYYANELKVTLADRYGQVRVHHRQTGAPLPRTYVKVYSRTDSGEASFYKDGYTDIRGCFDYASLSTDELDRVKRFALLIASEQHGALIREAEPPKR